MAEERNLGVARAVAETAGDEDSTKAELQRRMEEARESITQTVTEIKDTVANQYQSVKQSVTEALDWREQYRRRPVVWSVSALSVGFIVGYSLGGAFKGDEWERDYTDYEEDYEPRNVVSERSAAAAPAPAYAPQAITGAAAYGAASSYGQSSPAAARQSASDYSASAEAEVDEPDKPGLLERFKETKAYDRLQEEVASLGDRLLDEVSNVGRTVVLPMLFNKVRELFGVDLSNKQQSQTSGGSTSGGTRETSGTSGAQSSSSSSDSAYAASSTQAAASSGTAGGGGYGGSSR